MFKGVRGLVVLLLFLGGGVSYLDRAALSVAAPLVSRDLGLTPGQLGLVFSVFFVGYAPFCFVGGWASDRFGAKRVMTVAMLAWSVTCGLTAAAFTFPVLLVIRSLFGMGEGPFCSTASKTVSNWFPRREQASAVGLANAGEPLGAALAGPVVGLIATQFGWRVSFLAIAVIGLIWVACWAALTTERPGQHRWITREELAEIDEEADDPLPSDGVGTWAILRQPAILATAVAFFGFSYVLYFFLSWFPSYLSTSQHLDMRSMALVSVIPWVIGFIGLASGGFLCDLIYRITGRALFARKVVLVGSMVVAAVAVALAGLVSDITGAVALTALAVFAMYLSCNTYYAIILDMVDRRRVGGTTGFVHMIANCAGIVAPVVTGYIVQWTGSFAAAFVLTGAVALTGAIAVAVFVRSPARSAAASAGLGVADPSRS